MGSYYLRRQQWPVEEGGDPHRPYLPFSVQKPCSNFEHTKCDGSLCYGSQYCCQLCLTLRAGRFFVFGLPTETSSMSVRRGTRLLARPGSHSFEIMEVPNGRRSAAASPVRQSPVKALSGRTRNLPGNFLLLLDAPSRIVLITVAFPVRATVRSPGSGSRSSRSRLPTKDHPPKPAVESEDLLA
jgi:hypothetical protein